MSASVVERLMVGAEPPIIELFLAYAIAQLQGLSQRKRSLAIFAMWKLVHIPRYKSSLFCKAWRVPVFSCCCKNHRGVYAGLECIVAWD